ncbi:hypothetical protein CF038_27590 [Klebsiella michiganensis]|nr:hypothetical protein [Klebsiella michiganensis]MBW5996317.1 hypothetical protein [Klebsiella michiganensis]POT82104.1 hypothetical protein C3417_31565 [Klebsiella oxytoca]POV45208.1 hypothetical protein C3409_32345 [Klebsiella oxytoca]
MPFRVGVASLVRSPLCSWPVCSATLSVTCGMLAAGAVVSMVSSNAGERSLTLPALSVTVALRLWEPSLSSGNVKLQLPFSSATTEPSLVSPS